MRAGRNSCFLPVLPPPLATSKCAACPSQASFLHPTASRGDPQLPAQPSNPGTPPGKTQREPGLKERPLHEETSSGNDITVPLALLAPSPMASPGTPVAPEPSPALQWGDEEPQLCEPFPFPGQACPEPCPRGKQTRAAWDQSTKTVRGPSKPQREWGCSPSPAPTRAQP